MSTAALVPETWELDGDDARATMRRARVGPQDEQEGAVPAGVGSW